MRAFCGVLAALACHSAFVLAGGDGEGGDTGAAGPSPTASPTGTLTLVVSTPDQPNFDTKCTLSPDGFLGENVLWAQSQAVDQPGYLIYSRCAPTGMIACAVRRVELSLRKRPLPVVLGKHGLFDSALRKVPPKA